MSGIYQLAADGRLDGRLAAVGGYWGQFAFPCPYVPHHAILDGFCSGGQFADDPESAQNLGGSSNTRGVPLAVPETANRDQLWSAGGVNGAAAMVVLIVHGADSRAGQCRDTMRADCRARLVIDSVAWVNGEATAPNPDTSAIPNVSLTSGAVIAAGVKPGEQLVTAYPLLATDLNDVDPRLLGQGSGAVWFLRILSGAPDADAISDGVVRLVSDSSASVTAELPLVLPVEYDPARVVLDASGWNGNGDAWPRFSVSAGETVLAAGRLGSESTPLAIAAGDYTVHAFVGTLRGDPVGGPTCDLLLTVEAGADLTYHAEFHKRNDCAWKTGTWPSQ